MDYVFILPKLAIASVGGVGVLAKFQKLRSDPTYAGPSLYGVVSL